MKRDEVFLSLIIFIFCFPCLYANGSRESADFTSLPDWVNSLEKNYPNHDWIAVVGAGASQGQAETMAMASLARTFRTDVNSLTQSARRYSQIINGTTGNTTFDESQNFSQQINVNSDIRGLIGVQIDVYRFDGARNVRSAAAAETTCYVLARMNRRECSARYSAIIKENTAVIEKLLSSASTAQTLLTYSRLSFAYSIAQATDNFQHILEVLDPTAVNRKPSYGSADAIKERMLEAAGLITIAVNVNTEDKTTEVLLTRAVGSFFRDLGFSTKDQGTENYVLGVNVRFEDISQNVFSCRYFLNASLTDRNSTAIFSFTEDDRKAHQNNPSEARRLAVRAVEESLKEGKFAEEFNFWLMKNE